MSARKIIEIGRRYWYIVLLTLLVVTSCQWLTDTTNSALPQAPTTAVTDGWQQVTIGGGGYITGIYLHPREPNLVYARTDNGGYYRWQAAQQRWQPITESLPATAWDYDHYSGGEALALDPQNPNLVYIAVGKYSDRPGTVYKSTDLGTTWQKSNLAVPMGGDEDLRWGGDRLVVSPADSNLLLFGSRKNGLWRSLDGGINWNQVGDLPRVNNTLGVMAIAFAPEGQSVYASVYDDGIYQSKDWGRTWQKLEGSPARVMQLKVALDGVVYVTRDGSPQVSKYESGRWRNITPKGIFVHHIFNGLSLHPQAADTLIVSEGDRGWGKIYYSSDRGKSWKFTRPKLDKSVTWLASEFFNDHNAALAFDPQDPKQVWLSDWFGIWHTSDIGAKSVTWTNRVGGIEQTVLLALAAPPEGAMLLSGIADQDGFYHHDLHDYPQSRLGFNPQRHNHFKLSGDRYLDNYFQDTLDIAYCQNQPLNLIRLGGKRWRNVYTGVTSSDGGLTWKPWANIPAERQFTRVAIDPNDYRHFVITTSEGQPLVTFDNGVSWQDVTGLPDGEQGPWIWNQPLAVDGVNGDRFYYFAEGTVYRSDDGGINFSVVAQDLPLGEKHILTVVPHRAGELWLALDDGGLYHSTDGGDTLARIDEFSQAHLVTVGKANTASLDDRNIYVYGTIKEQTGLYLTNNGRRWQRDRFPLPKTTKILVASQQEPGLIFAGTDGRGIYYSAKGRTN